MLVEKIVAYNVVGGTIDDLYYQMEEALEEGWEPFDSLVVHTFIPMGGQPEMKFFQPVVMKELIGVIEEEELEELYEEPSPSLRRKKT